MSQPPPRDDKNRLDALRNREEHFDQQLLHSQKMEALGRLAGGIAHDFNNLLTGISGYTHLMLMLLHDEGPLRRYATEIKKASEQAARLTQQLLAFSRRQVIQPKVLDLNAVVTDMDSLLRRLIGEEIALVTVLGAGLGRVKADPGQLQQVILNLAINARDAMPHAGTLTIETANAMMDESSARTHHGAQPGRYVSLTVRDTGCGMDAETQARIFEPFFTTKEPGKGTGLGLAMSYGIVQQCGGYIAVDSEPGRGSTFTICFPRAESRESIAEALGDPGAHAGGSETILVVEDELAVRNLVKEILEKHGYTILEATRGEEALRICERYGGPIHLLLADVVMPGMSGVETARRTAALRPGLPVLYISGYMDDATRRHGLENTSPAFLQKPFTPGDLARKVRDVLDSPRRPMPADVHA